MCWFHYMISFLSVVVDYRFLCGTNSWLGSSWMWRQLSTKKATVVVNCLEMEEVDGCKEVSAVELAIANELYVTVMTSSMHVTSSSCWLFCVRYPWHSCGVGEDNLSERVTHGIASPWLLSHLLLGRESGNGWRCNREVYYGGCTVDDYYRGVQKGCAVPARSGDLTPT